MLKNNIEKVLSQIADFEARQSLDEISISTDFGYDEDENDEGLSSEDLIGKKLKIHLGDLDLMTWKVDLEGDHQLILGLLRSIKVIDAAHDAKLQHLKQQVIEKVQQPINPSNYKVIIFTAFADTAHYIYEHLAPYLHEQHQLHSAVS